MKCFYHPGQDAVGTCAQCGKAACHDCLKELSNGMFCKGCIAQQLRSAEAEKQQIREDQEAIVAKAARRIKTSKIVFVGFAILAVCELPFMWLTALRTHQFGAAFLFQSIVGCALAALMIGYTAWSFYWGIPALWTGIKKVCSKLPFLVVLGPLDGLIEFMVLLMVLVFVGEFYCLLGGGWSQYRKRVRIVQAGSRALAPA